MEFYKEAWFWILLIGLAGAIISIILFEYFRIPGARVPFWIYALIILSLLIIIIGIIIAIVTVAHNKTIESLSNPTVQKILGINGDGTTKTTTTTATAKTPSGKPAVVKKSTVVSNN